MKFAVISPGYSATDWAMFSIGSVLGQVNADLYHIIIDDGFKTDIGKYYFYLTDNFPIYWKSTAEKRGALASHLDAMNHLKDLEDRKSNKALKDTDIIVHLDLDDWLLTPFALQRIKKEYENGAWATYGNYLATNGENSVCKPYNKKFNRKTDTFHWFFSHLRTFRYGLWKHIRPDALLDRDGIPFKMAGDVAICSSILELCPVDKVHFIKDPLMVYNRMTPFNENKMNIQLQQDCVKQIISKEPHLELTDAEFIHP